MRTLVVLLLIGASSSPALADRPRLLVLDGLPPTEVAPATAPYNVIYLNRCASGCTVKKGTNDSRADSSDIVGSGVHAMPAFPYGDAAWASVVSCVRDTFESFNVQITDVDPGSANHFEIMIAGRSTDVGIPNPQGGIIGGVSANGCGQTYIPNALVFDFAAAWSQSLTNCGPACIEDVCSTAAQEIGHSFGMDHSHNAADPMTYFNFNTRRYFQNEADPCGSDCTNGTGPMGNACSGADSQVHACCVNRGSTQNSYATLTSLFGPGSPTPPIISISTPQQGAMVKAGFPVDATATDDSAIQRVELTVDGVLVQTLMTQPYGFNAPATLGDGNHTVAITAYDAHGTPGTKTITVNIGPPCGSAADCPMSTDACIGGRCVPGPGVTGGLGTSCTANSDCGDQNCASDGTNQYCTTACTQGQCPDGFGCLPTMEGAPTGYCWPGYSDGGGGSGCSSGAGGSVTCGLMFAALLVSRRKKK
jgi:hypothetical protein